MTALPPTSRRLLRIVAALLAAAAWAGLAAQVLALATISHRRGMGVGLVLNGFFAYFTNLTNLLVAGLLTRIAWRPGVTLEPRFSRTAAAAVTYIIIVGAVDQILLRGVWHPKGLFAVGDVFTHIVMPIAYPIFWLTLLPACRPEWSSALRWLIYPVAYAGVSEARGAVDHWYPYPFFDPGKIGVGHLFLILLFLAAAIVLINAAIIAIDREVKTFVGAGDDDDIA